MSELITNLHPAQQELQDFLYVISHDFNAHLRHIREFSKILIEEADSLNSIQTEAAHHIQQAVQFTEAKLAGLLQLSRLNTKTEEFAQINLGETLADIIQQLHQHMNTQAVQIDLNTIQDITVKPQRFKLLLINLIANAIAATHPERDLHLQITAQQRDNQYILTLTDNGVGIQPDQIEHAQKLFQKLNLDTLSSPYTAGCGIGLNLCQVIAEQHAGILTFIPQNVGLKVQLCFPHYVA